MVKVYKNPALKSLGDTPQLPSALSIAFYNNPRIFDLIVAGAERQSQKDFCLIIADDGSKPEVVDHIQKKLESLAIPSIHLWHEDLGFRKNRMLNWVLFHSPAENIVFVDQDCIPHREFMKEHNLHQKDNAVLCGRRMELAPWMSKRLVPTEVRQGSIEKNLWWMVPLNSFRHDNHSGKGIYIQNPTLRALLNRKPKGIVGCNFSVHRRDLLKINGFDFRYEGPSTGEDTDIEYRMRQKGVDMISFSNAAVVYHVWHPLTKKQSKNELIFEQVKKDGHAFTQFGLWQQLEEAGISAQNFFDTYKIQKS